MNRVSMTGLRAFERVVATGSQRQAGEDLGVTQTAISHAIRGLETQLGADLFRRDSNSSSLTRTGRDLAAELGPAFGRIDRVVERLIGERDLVTLSTTPAFAACWLAPELAQAAAAGKSLPVRLHATTDLEPLTSHGAGIAVRYAEKADGEHLIQETFHAVVNQSVHDKGEAYGDLPLIETSWVQGREYAPTWRTWFEASDRDIPKTQKIIRFADEHQALQAGLAGAGIVLISSVLSAPLLKRGLLRIVRADVEITGLSYWLMVDPERTTERNVAVISEWVRNKFQLMRLDSGAVIG
jgi:LysR family transcriptional regulator, glycine cleavage system transcriptional activator